jgi:outer membrane protein TolC
VPFAALLAQALGTQPEALAPAGLGAPERRQRQAALADRVRQLQGAWLQAIAARARLQRAADALDNARTGAELGRRMVVAGNWSPMKHLAELQTETRARQAWLNAQLAERSAMEQLGRLLGLWQAAQIDTLRQQLPTDLPAAPPTAPEAPAQGVESAVLSAHTTLDSARAQVARLQRGGEPAPAWLDALSEAADAAAGASAGGPVALPELADPRQRNDHRSAHAAEAGAGLLRQAADRRSQAREAWAALQTHQALARLAQDLDLPQQEALEQAVLQRYNGMFVSTWALLAAARERLAALDRLTDARLAYWLAEADWRALLAGGHYAGAQRASNPTTPGGNAAQGH